MEGIFNSKELLEYLESLENTNTTRKLTYYFKAIQKKLNPDIYMLKIYINYINILKKFENTDEIRRIYKMLKIDYQKFKLYWQSLINFEIENNGHVNKIVCNAINSLKLKCFSEKDSIIKYLIDIRKLYDPDFVYFSDIYFKNDSINANNASINANFNNDYNKKEIKYNKEGIYNNINNTGSNNTFNNDNIKENLYNDNINNTFNNDNINNASINADFNNINNKNNKDNINNLNNNLLIDDNKNNNLLIDYNKDNNVTKIPCKLISDEYTLSLTEQLNFISKFKENNKKKENNNEVKENNENNNEIKGNNENNNEIKENNENNNTYDEIYKKLKKRKIKYLQMKDKKLCILRMIGRGGSSKVFHVLWNNENYALKRVNTNYTQEYINEIKILEKLKGVPGIIQLIDYEINEEEILILLEYGDTDLRFILQENLSVNFIRFIWEQIILIVKRIYEERIVHCDLKPSNFIFVKGRIKLIDFGISKVGNNNTTSVHNDARGTLNYMAPEVVDKKKVNRSCDIWSLGCILYELIYNKNIRKGSMIDGRLGYNNGSINMNNNLNENKMDQILNNIYQLNVKFEIKYPEKKGYEKLIEVCKSCLKWDPDKRVNINDLIIENLNYQQDRDENHNFNRDNIKKIVKYVKKNINLSNDELVEYIYDFLL